MTSIAPFPGTIEAVNARLAPLGVSFPAPGRQSTGPAARLVWTGRDQAFLVGAPAPDLTGLAATTDQSDGWATLTLAGPLAGDTLARLIPLDLRDAAFPVGHTARTGLNHMSAILSRSGPAAWEIMVFRSMARTAWHELAEALEMQAARLNALA
ncbi:sarcosine oxidase subunit gamma [Gemmobacter aquarius]|uniref:Sarcosine oxidase subunit gamma n=2 Tax=Paragemmobacter aquarius TaxID=2169400 RepID=A0A2S0UQX8_9RHOB|nr:sarcosine oxidase subunit gamma [Gemmobacter aquarius]